MEKKKKRTSDVDMTDLEGEEKMEGKGVWLELLAPYSS